MLSEFIKCSNLAANVIINAWIEYKQNKNKGIVRACTKKCHNQVWRGQLRRHVTTSREFHDFFIKFPVIATQKFDGTNVGITEDGLMLGRRLVIRSDASLYQGTCLQEVRDTLKKVNAVKNALLGVACESNIALKERLHCTIYGELMCNGRRFDYSERGLEGTYACFGIILRGTQVCTCFPTHVFLHKLRYFVLH